MQYSKKTILEIKRKVEFLGVDLSFTEQAVKEEVNITELREAFEIDRQLIKGMINDIEILIG